MKEKIYDEIIKLDGFDYLIVDKICLNDTNYIYAHLIDNKKEYTILREIKENGEVFVESVDEKTHDLLINKFKIN